MTYPSQGRAQTNCCQLFAWFVSNPAYCRLIAVAFFFVIAAGVGLWLWLGSGSKAVDQNAPVPPKTIVTPWANNQEMETLANRATTIAGAWTCEDRASTLEGGSAVVKTVRMTLTQNGNVVSGTFVLYGAPLPVRNGTFDGQKFES